MNKLPEAKTPQTLDDVAEMLQVLEQDMLNLLSEDYQLSDDKDQRYLRRLNEDVIRLSTLISVLISLSLIVYPSIAKNLERTMRAVSFDWRTPLNSLRFQLGLLQTGTVGVLTDTQTQASTKISQAADALWAWGEALILSERSD